MSVDIVTFGCRLNAFESEVIAREASAPGSPTPSSSTVVLSPTKLWRRRGNRSAGEARAPQARIVVTGCAAQTQARMFADMADVDRVVGNDDKDARRGMAPGARRVRRGACIRIASEEKIAVADHHGVREMAPHLLEGFQRACRGVFVQVQNGCDHRCTFCIIPMAAAIALVPMGAVVAAVLHLHEHPRQAFLNPSNRCGAISRTAMNVATAIFSSLAMRMQAPRRTRRALAPCLAAHLVALPTTRSTSAISANIRACVCAAQPVTTIRACGRSRFSRRIDCRAAPQLRW